MKGLVRGLALNAPKHTADLGKSKSGRIDPEAHLDDQCDHFGKLWKAEVKSKQKEVAQESLKLRNTTFEAG